MYTYVSVGDNYANHAMRNKQRHYGISNVSNHNEEYQRMNLETCAN